MDQVKIGNYISDKRKALNLTQAQLAEKLGMSNKSVSKWERGICLPDVSVYEDLCGFLGITINEFLAGEDLEPNQAIIQADKNIVDVTLISKLRREKLRKIIAALIALMVLMSSVVIWFLSKEGYFQNNYIRPYESDSKEYQTVCKFVSDDIEMFHYKVDRRYRSLTITAYECKPGQDEFKAILSMPLHIYGNSEGTIALIHDSVSRLIKLNIANSESMVSTDVGTEFAKLESGVATNRSDEIDSVRPETEYPICAYYYGDGVISANPPYEVFADPKANIGKDNYCIVFTASFSEEKNTNITVPDLSDMTVEEAQIELEEYGLILGTVLYNDNESDSKQVVCFQNPSAGSKVSEGTAVDIDVKLKGN